MELLAVSFDDYQKMNGSRHTTTKHLNDEKTHAANNSKRIKKLNHVDNTLYEVELAKAEIEHKEPILVVFSITQNGGLRSLGPIITFSLKFLMLPSSKIWRWMKLLRFLLCPRRNWKIVSGLK